MIKTEKSLKLKLISVINEIIFAVGDLTVSQKSNLFKAAIQAKKILETIDSEESDLTPIYPFKEHKWTQFGMLEHSLSVVNMMLNENRSFSAACAIRAQETGKTVPSIRQACCRVLNLSSTDWNKMKSEKKSQILIFEKLKDKYPTEINNIKEIFKFADGG